MNTSKLLVLLALVLLCAGMFQSCALITAGKQTISVSTQPSSASIYLDGLKIGTGAWAGKISRNYHKHSIEVKNEGFEPVWIPLKKEIRKGYLIGDIALLVIPPIGVPMLVIDLATGAWTKVMNPEIVVRMDSLPKTKEPRKVIKIIVEDEKE